MGKTLLQKVWDRHTVRTLPTGQTQLFIGLHLIHEVTSPQAFDMLRLRGREGPAGNRTGATAPDQAGDRRHSLRRRGRRGHRTGARLFHRLSAFVAVDRADEGWQAALDARAPQHRKPERRDDRAEPDRRVRQILRALRR